MTRRSHGRRRAMKSAIGRGKTNAYSVSSRPCPSPLPMPWRTLSMPSSFVDVNPYAEAANDADGDDLLVCCCSRILAKRVRWRVELDIRSDRMINPAFSVPNRMTSGGSASRSATLLARETASLPEAGRLRMRTADSTRRNGTAKSMTSSRCSVTYSGAAMMSTSCS